MNRRSIVPKIQNTVPFTYKIKDLINVQAEGSFYKPALQKTTEEICRIEKVFGMRIKNKKKEADVKWKGCDNSFSQWISNSEVINLKQMSG